jgi:hypothetical protein
MYFVYAKLQVLLGPNGALYEYSDDVYLVSDPVSRAKALTASLGTYGKIGLMIGWGLGKTELILPPDSFPAAFLAHLETAGKACFTL